jgi:tRNA-splicing ligase RtcB (3'-phosphate/5'-hydroxy nucleic acid ligase)
MKTACAPLEIPTTPGALPIRCFTGEDLLPDEPARRQLAELAALPGLDRHVTVLPDVHVKSRNPTPTGTVVVSRTMLVPRAIDQGINCGMRIVATGVAVREFTAPVLDALFGRLVTTIAMAPHEPPLLTTEECERMLVHGLPALAGVLDLPPEDLRRVENGGRMTPLLDPSAIRAVVTAKAIGKGNPLLGTVGGGNHFVELQEIVEVLEPMAARRLGLVRGQAVFMLHTCSRRLGKQLLRPVCEEAERLAANGGPAPALWTIRLDTDLGQRLLAALAAATHAAFANRATVTHLLRQTVREVLGNSTLRLPLVYDCGHETIQREAHQGEWVWVHRHGASHAVPPATLDDPVLAEVGQPVPIPGSMGTDSFIGVAQAGVAQTFHSVAHGAGRVMEKATAAERFDAGQVEREVRNEGIRLYRYGKDNIAGQAPASFKDPRCVVDAMEAHDLVQPVVRLRPLAVLKG